MYLLPTTAPSFPPSPSSHSWIIGKEGSYIHQLEERSKAVVRISDSSSREYGREWKYVQLSGAPRAVDRAKKLLHIRLERLMQRLFAGGNGQKGGKGGMSAGEEEEEEKGEEDVNGEMDGLEKEKGKGKGKGKEQRKKNKQARPSSAPAASSTSTLAAAPAVSAAAIAPAAADPAAAGQENEQGKGEEGKKEGKGEDNVLVEEESA